MSQIDPISRLQVWSVTILLTIFFSFAPSSFAQWERNATFDPSPTPTCCMLTTTVGTSCQYHPAGPTYDIFVSALVANSCGQAVDSAANFYLDGSVDGNNFEFIARTSMQNYTFQPGQNTLNESFLSVTVADNYQFYRVRAQFYNCGIYSYNSPAAPVCRPGVTPSPTPSPPSISGTVTYGNAIGAPTPPFVTHVWCAEKVRLRLLL